MENMQNALDSEVELLCKDKNGVSIFRGTRLNCVMEDGSVISGTAAYSFEDPDNEDEGEWFVLVDLENGVPMAFPIPQDDKVVYLTVSAE